MKYQYLRELVYEANLELVRKNLVVYTFGNVSGIERKEGIVAIKPSGVPYDEMKPDDIVVVDLNGKRVDGTLNPSSDLDTHLEVYRSFNVGGVVHTHAKYSTAWAQAGRGIPCYGTTHADYCNGEIPCTRPMTPEEINGSYEQQTGNVIVECFGMEDGAHYPGVLVYSHGPFAWGQDVDEAVFNAGIIEYIAEMAMHTESINSIIGPADQVLIDKHYNRKHGKDAYYGQK